VVPRMAQELMRHSDIRLTMNTYTHLQLIDTAGAVERLPSIGLERHQTCLQAVTRHTATPYVAVTCESAEVLDRDASVSIGYNEGVVSLWNLACHPQAVQRGLGSYP